MGLTQSGDALNEEHTLRIYLTWGLFKKQEMCNMDYVGLLNMELNQTNVGLYLKIKENRLQIT